MGKIIFSYAKGPLQRIKRILGRRRCYADLRSWSSNTYVYLLENAPHLPLPCRRRDFAMRPRDFPQPVFVRANVGDLGAVAELLEGHEYERINEFVVNPVRNILDLGGNIGLSVRMWQHWFPEAAILVAEPDSGNFAQLNKNIAVGPAPERITAVRAFAAAESGMAWLDRSENNTMVFKMMDCGGENSEMIPKMAIGDLVTSAANTDGRVDFLKCDVEGTEQEIFAACGTWLYRVRAAAVETHPPYSADALLADIRRAGVEIAVHSVTAKETGSFLVWLRFR